MWHAELRLGVSLSNPAHHNKRQRLDTTGIVETLLKEANEFRVFELKVTRAAGFQIALRKGWVVAKPGGGYDLPVFSPLGAVCWAPDGQRSYQDETDVKEGDCVVESYKYRLTTSQTESPGMTSQPDQSTPADSTKLWWTFYVPVAQAMAEKLRTCPGHAARVDAVFSDTNHDHMNRLMKRPGS